MSTTFTSRAGLAITTVIVGSLALSLMLVWAPSLVPALVALLVIAIIICSGIASVRSVGLDRFGWALFGSGALMCVVATLAAPVIPVDYLAGWVCVAGATISVVGCLCFAACTNAEVVMATMQTTMFTTSVFITTWVLTESKARRWTPGPAHTLAALGDSLLATALIACVITALVVAARGALERLVFTLLHAGVLAIVVPVTISWLATNRETLGSASVLAAPGLVLVLAAVLVAATNEVDQGRRVVIDHTGTITLIVVVTLAGVATLVAASNDGLDVVLGHALSMLICLLAATHIADTRRSRALTASIEKQAGHMRLLVSKTRDIIIELDPEGHIVFASEAMRNILGLRKNQFEGQHISSVIPELTGEALRHVEHSPAARVQPTMRVDSVLTSAGGAYVHAESVVTPLAVGYLVAVRDVSERVGLQSRLQQVTYHDIATGLPNRSSLDRELRHRLYEASGGDVALVLVDHSATSIGAAVATGTYGDESNDELLTQIGAALRAVVRPGDMVARFSDHRFAVLLHAGTSPDDALLQAERAVLGLANAVHIPDVELRAVAGVYVGSQSGADIVRNAELAVRHAQTAGPGAVRLFEPGMLAQYARTRDLRRRLAHPPDAEHWTLLYQPVVHLQTGRTQGVETLLRWTDPEGDLLGIEEIVRLAEEFGSIIPIGTWVMDQAVAQASRWERSGRPLSVAVNVSVHQLTAPNFLSVVEQTLERHALTPSLLTLEITETVVLEQTKETWQTISELRALGVRIAIDDFGTGYTGFGNLRTLPLDILKIDKSFIRGLGTGTGDAVVAAVARLGLELGLAITAEGIETPEQERLARSLGITAAQGYLYARPLPAADITALVARADATVDVAR